MTAFEVLKKLPLPSGVPLIYQESVVEFLQSEIRDAVDVLTNLCPYMDEHDQCLGSPTALDHLCNKSFSEKLPKLQEETLEDFSSHESIRGKFRRFSKNNVLKEDGCIDKKAQNDLLRKIPFIAESYGPKLIQLMARHFQEEENKEHALMEHIMDCWFESDCKICRTSGSFVHGSILTAMQRKGLLYKAEERQNDMSRILPGLHTCGAKAILNWLDKKN